MKNNKGFTLIELLAVIAILALLVLIAVPMITRYVTNARNFSVDKILRTAEDAAVDYAMEYSKGDFFIPDKCAKTIIISKTSDYSNTDTCIKKVQVSTLINKNYLKDSASKLKTEGYIIVYKYKDASKNTYELKAYADSSLVK